MLSNLQSELNRNILLDIKIYYIFFIALHCILYLIYFPTFVFMTVVTQLLHKKRNIASKFAK